MINHMDTLNLDNVIYTIIMKYIGCYHLTPPPPTFIDISLVPCLFLKGGKKKGEEHEEEEGEEENYTQRRRHARKC